MGCPPVWQIVQQSTMAKLLAVSKGAIDSAIVDPTWWNALKSTHDGVVPDNPQESNWKEVNGMLLDYAKQFSDTLAIFNPMYYSAELFSIAAQCPTEGGPAVYSAREMLKQWKLADANLWADCEQLLVGGQARGVSMEPTGWIESPDAIPHEEQLFGMQTANPIPKLSLMPNPANTVVNISWSSKENLKSVDAIDASGRLHSLPIREHNPSNAVLDVENLAPGLYLIRVHTAHEIYQEKLMKD